MVLAHDVHPTILHLCECLHDQEAVKYNVGGREKWQCSSHSPLHVLSGSQTT